jgi:hypothetical protein
MALLVGFITSYPMNWWLISHHLKHGMMTLRSSQEPAYGVNHKGMLDHKTSGEHTGHGQQKPQASMSDDMKPVTNKVLAGMTVLSCVLFGLGLGIAIIFGG